MKKTAFFALILIICTPILACSRQYVNDVACKSISDNLIKFSNGGEYVEYTQTHLGLYFDELDDCDDYSVVYSQDVTDINEIGVFHVKDGQNADDIREMCEEYLAEIREDSRSFIASYAPDEVPKLDASSVRQYGNYVIYSILPTDAQDALDSHLQNLLRK